MSYDSSEPIDALIAEYTDYCAQQDYAEVPEDQFLLRSRLACDASDYRIEIDMQLPRYDATRVTVTFLGNQT